MKLKKWMFLLAIVLGLTSCDNETSDDSQTEIVYADVKPTQTKYKAYYGTKISKILGSIASKSTAANPGVETTKPVSVIFYPRTQTISFSNIFDNTTVEYKVTSIGNVTNSVTYIFKINGVEYQCIISEKTDSAAATIKITFAGGYYQFEVTEAAKAKILQLVVKEIATSPNKASTYTVQYSYNDSLLIQSVRNSFDPNTLEPLVSITDFSYAADGKLTGKISKDGNGVVKSKVVYDYTNNQITKSTASNAEGTVTQISKYEYDSNGRIAACYFGNSTNTSYNLIYHFSYDTNKLTTIYTNSKETFRDVEISTYDSSRKPFLISQDQIVNPFAILDIETSVSTDQDGVVTDFGTVTYEYSAQGLRVKAITANENGDPDVRTRTYKEE